MEQMICNINMLFEHLIFFYVIFRKEYRKFEKVKIIGLVTCLLVWIIGLIAGFDLRIVSIGPLPVFLILIYTVIWLLFEISIIEMVVLGIGQWLMLSMLESILYIILQQLQLERYILENIIMLLISGGLLIFYFLVGKKYNIKAFHLPIKMWCLLDVIILILTTMMSFFTYVLVQELPNSKTMLIGRTLSVFGGTVIIVLLFVMLYYYNSSYDFCRQKDIAEMQNEQQREYFLQLLEQEEETRSFRHDIINDLLEMHNYCVNKKCKQMEQYLESTLGIVQKISKSNYNVGNDSVNMVMNYYLRSIKEKCSIEINGYMSERLSVEDRDICVLFANLIKNAAEAVSKMDDGKIWIKIMEGKNYLYIQVKNTFDGKIEFDKKGITVTTKPDKKNHGIGIRSIVSIVKKNGGTYNVETAGGIYKVEIYLKI